MALPKLNCAIESMDEAHLESVMEIERLSNPSPWSESSIRGELSNAQASYFVALESKQVVGFCGYWRVIDEAHITNVAVHPNFRRKGVGYTLVQHTLKHAKSKGIRCATLEVRSNNVGAIALYKQFGFVQSAVRKGYYPKDGQDAAVMWCYDLGKAD